MLAVDMNFQQYKRKNTECYEIRESKYHSKKIFEKLSKEYYKVMCIFFFQVVCLSYKNLNVVYLNAVT